MLSTELQMHDITLPESFPNLPSAMGKLQELFAANNIDAQSLIALLQDDPLLCANILKLVNSPHYGLSKKVASLHQAVMLLGTTIIRGIVMAAVLKKSFSLDISPYGIDIDRFDTICSLRVQFVTLWQKGEDIDLQQLSSAAFLMEAGKIITANAIINLKLLSSFKELRERLDIQESEKKLFGLQSYEVAAKLFEQWDFEKNFIDLIANITEPKTKEEEILYVLWRVINIENIFVDATLEEMLVFVDTRNLNREKFKNAIEIIKEELV